MDERYPPQPWHLRGNGYLALWRLPADRIPGHWRLPDSVRPLLFGRHALVATAWVDYRPGGTLAYRELLVALAVRERRRIAACAVEAWVDDERSLTGGRALWGVPKQLGTFAFTTSPGGRVRTSLSPEDLPADEPVTAWHQDLLRLPARLPLRGRLLQPAPGPVVPPETVRVPLRLSGSLCLGRARLAARPGGPLGCLVGRTPVLALSLKDFRFTVGDAGRHATPPVGG
ncbi:hypothetical protein RKD49_000128 [Streptomyces glaucescens]